MLTPPAQSNWIAKSITMSDCLIPFRVRQSFWQTWATILIWILKQNRTWNLTHPEIIENTVPSRHFAVKEVNWSDYQPSPEACNTRMRHERKRERGRNAGCNECNRRSAVRSLLRYPSIDANCRHVFADPMITRNNFLRGIM